jgi:NADH-quinone oxidoreductase subunit H
MSLAAPLLAGIFDRAADGSASFGWVIGRILLVLLVVHVILILGALMVWAERRVSAWMQDRLGPNRVGPEGLLQPLADLGKFMFKEDVIPAHVNPWMYTLAPAIALVPALVTFAVIPFTGSHDAGSLTVVRSDAPEAAQVLAGAPLADPTLVEDAGPGGRTLVGVSELSLDAWRATKAPEGAGGFTEAGSEGPYAVFERAGARVAVPRGSEAERTFAKDPGALGASAREGWTLVAADEAYESWQIANLDIGVLYILSITGLGVYGITLGGWASNSKYSLLGGVRASAQMISYELSLGLAVVPVVLTVGSLNLGDIVAYQAQDGWFLFWQPVAFFVFLVASYAETNRLPFDMPESETELVAGYHTEYSSMKFALFFLAEYTNMTVGSALLVTLYLGGWTFFGLEHLGWLMGVLIFSAKTLFFLFAFIWVRWTLPRFRYDQLMALGWAWLIPITLLNIVLTAGALVFEEPWMHALLPAVLVGAAVLAAWVSWRRDAGAVRPLREWAPSGGGGAA